MPSLSVNFYENYGVYAMDMRIISLDIETANLDMKAEGLSFDDPKGWRTSVVCLHDGVLNMTHTYVHPDEYEEVKKTHDKSLGRLYPFDVLEYHLRRKRNEGYTLLTHNGLKFDLPIISKPIKDGGVGGCASLLKKWPKEQMMDTAAVLTQVTGERYHLNHLIHGLLGENHSKLMDAANAPIQWAEGNHAEVIRYCIDDTQKTLAVFLTAGSEGEFRAIGKDSYRTVPIKEYVQSWFQSHEH